MEIIHPIIICTALVFSIVAIKSKDLIISIISLPLTGLLVSLEFYMLQAPDVAMAEASIGAALTTAAYVLVIKKTGRYEK